MHRIRSAALALVTAAALSTAPAATAVSSDVSARTPQATVAGHLGSLGPAARLAAQRGRLAVLPQLAGAGRRPQAAAAARNVVVATFKPGVAGRAVALQRRQGGRWVTLQRGAQSRAGTAQFTVPHRFRGAPAVYRARTTGKSRPASATAGISTERTPTFTDQFNGSRLDRSVWATRAQGFDAASNRRCSEADDRAVRVASGTLRLQVRNHPDRGTCRYEGRRYAYRINGHIGTQGTIERRYGFFAARIKFQPRRGQHGAFWLQTTGVPGGPARTSGAEIDVIEWFGGNHPNGGLTSFVYAAGRRIGGFIKNVGRFGDGWASKYHVYSVEWRPGRYIFRIDGKVTFQTTRGVSRVPEFLILSLLSSDYELKYLGDGRLPQTMHVDWVRHWKLS